jgi:diaminohydroxyphosphoribosylaminopyrimidine deaminase/5-amino-6-(5-phosphoribosylamino)uracil reductase
MAAGTPSDPRAWSPSEAGHLRRALELADRGGGRTSPNPRVGAVLTRDGEVVGEGHHRVGGGPHAEIEALRRAGDRARGATLYVTLEPCNCQRDGRPHAARW